MADIPVERKAGGLPGWLIPLLLALVLLPLLWFMLRGCGPAAVVDNTNGNANRVITTANTNANRMINSNANNAVVITNTTNVDVRNNSGSVINDINYYGGENDKSRLVGRGFFSNGGVRVERVLSDKVFTVKSGSGELFVMLDQKLDSPGGRESQITLRPGQNVNLGGEFRTVPTGEVREERQTGGLNSNEYAQMKGQQVYLHATSVSDAK